MGASAKLRPREGIERPYERYRRPRLRAARTRFTALRGYYEQDLYKGAWASLLRGPEDRDERDIEKRLAHAVYWQGLRELRSRKPPAYGVARNCAIYLRVARRIKAGTRNLPIRPHSDLTREAEIRALGDLVREVIADLSPRQQTISKIQWGWGLPRAQVAALLGLSERQVKRELEDAAPVLARNVELISAERWCEARRSLVVAYAFQLLRHDAPRFPNNTSNTVRGVDSLFAQSASGLTGLRRSHPSERRSSHPPSALFPTLPHRSSLRARTLPISSVRPNSGPLRC